MMEVLEIFLVLLSIKLPVADGFSVTEECPRGWVEYSETCYKFIRAPPESRDVALDRCRFFGANLLSVDLPEEHSFIIDWLRENDPQHRTWYTSGVDVGNNQWRWQSNDKPFFNLDQAWLPVNQFENFRFTAYNFSESAGRWGFLRVSGREPFPFICEIRKELLGIVVREERGYDYGITVKDPERIPKAPYFIEEPVDTVFDISTRDVRRDISLTCRAGGYPHPTYRWFKEEYINDQFVPKIVDPLSNTNLTMAEGTLTFYNPQQFLDRGTYYCEASNKFGTVISRSAKLTFGYIGQFNLKRSTESGRQYWGKAIFCDPPQHYPEVIYYWARDKLDKFVDEDRRVFVSQDGYLYFSSLDTIDRGNYFCVVQSSVQGAGRIGPMFTLEVSTYSSNQQLTFPNNFPKAFPEAPIAGQDVQLECLAFGFPVPSYNWTRKGFSSQLPQNATLAKYDRVLILPKVAVEDMGEYVCTANNRLNSISASVTLSIQAKPVFTIPLQDMHMDELAELNWICEAFGIPDVRYEWLKNGEPLLRSVKREDLDRYVVSGNALYIRGLNPSRDQGVYQCKATNQLGSTYSSGELRILTLPPSFTKYPLQKETFAAEGGNVTIKCRPEAAPAPQFRWLRNGQALTPDQRRVFVMPNGHLIINGVMLMDEGRYTCVVNNKYGRAESEGKLVVLRAPNFVRRPPSSLVARVNDTVVLNCEVQTPPALDLSYVWLVNGIRADNFPHQRFISGSEPGTLLVYNLTFQDFGEFECQAVTPVHKISSSTQMTIEGPPGRPGGLQVFATDGRNVRLEWTDGATNGQAIQSFDIEGRTGWNSTWVLLLKDVNPRVNPATGRRSEIISGSLLTAWSQHEFRVIAKNGYGPSPPSAQSPAYNTKENRPMKFPEGVNGGGGNTGDLTITWKPLPMQDWNAPGIWYRVFYKPADAPESDYRRVDLKDFGNVGIKVVQVSTEHYYREYSVKVQAINRQGEGPISPEKIIFSAEARPNAVPVEVSAWPHNSTSLNVSWKPIDMSRESIRGKLIGFRIKYWRRDGDDPLYDATYHLSREIQNWALIVGLLPDTYYYVVSSVFNSAGSGPESERFLMRTFKSAPLQPPTSVKVNILTPTSVRVWWRATAPGQTEEPLKGFKVRYWEASQDFSTYKDVTVKVGNELVADVRGLKPGVQYKLRVLAYSDGGDGRMSSPLFEFRLGDAESLRGHTTRPIVSHLWVILLLVCLIFQLKP